MQNMKEKRDRGVFATKEGVEKLKNAKANQRNGSGKPWTYADIAEETGLDEKTIGRFLRQEQPVDESSARAICQALEVDVMEVIDFDSRYEKDRNGQLNNNDSVFSFTGSFEKNKINVAKLKVIEATLREITGDVSLQIVDIEEGSIKLILEGSQEGLEQLEQLFKSGRLNQLLDIPIEDVSFVDAKAYKDNKKRLAFTVAGDVTQSEIEALKAAFIETPNQNNIKIDNKPRLVQEILKRDLRWNLNGADLSDSNLRDANLRDANLRGANLQNVNFIIANLSGADLVGADLRNAHLVLTNLSYANLSTANLSGADIRCSNLSCANLSGTNLSGTNLRYVRFDNTRFGNANIENARFGNNIGISLEMRLDLIKRGAIFKDSPGENSLIHSPTPSRR